MIPAIMAQSQSKASSTTDIRSGSINAASTKRMMTRSTEQQVFAQLAAMRSSHFELLLLDFSSEDPQAAIVTVDEGAIQRRLGWLRAQNVKGFNINIRPVGNHLTLLDDLTQQQIQQLTESGYQPCVVVETSPNNFQAWLDHGRELDAADEATAAARVLAERFGCDKGAAGRRHAGRLAGFTNRKPSRQLPNGLFPYVKLHLGERRTFDKAASFRDEVTAALIAAAQSPSLPGTFRYSNASPAKRTIEQFYADPRYDGDLSRADFAYAIYAHSHGVPDADIESAILARDMSKKGNAQAQRRYARYTLRRAKRATHVK
jgi:hypothetical protein